MEIILLCSLTLLCVRGHNRHAMQEWKREQIFPSVITFEEALREISADRSLLAETLTLMESDFFMSIWKMNLCLLQGELSVVT